tara:strand:- start:1917 stop:6866 length:4950 start_codon:yes stop_codon:yes gene_type:complete
MPAQFKKKGDTPSFTIMPRPDYTDLYDNNLTTSDIQSGTVNDVTSTKLLLADFKLPASPSYGGGELIGAEAGLYVNSITTGDGVHSSTLKGFFMKKEIGDREGGKSSGTGSMIASEDIIAISAFHDPQIPTFTEDFSGAGRQGYTIGASNQFVSGNQAYLTRTDAYEEGLNYGERTLTELFRMSKSEHFEAFGETSGLMGEHVKIMRNTYTGYTSFLNLMYYSEKEYKSWVGHRREKFDPLYMSDKVKTTTGSPTNLVGALQSQGAASGGAAGATATGGMFGEEIEAVSSRTSTFDIVQQDRAFASVDADGNTSIVCYARPTLATGKVLTGGKSLHMEAVYPHRDHMVTNVFYGKRGGQDGSENQQVTFVSKCLPKPVHLYSKEPSASGDNKQPIVPTIEMDINIDEIAPMLIRDQNSSYAEPAHDFRLTRSITVTFGEEPPVRGDNLHNYVKDHAPNANADGTGSGTGLGTSAKSFFGLSLVNNAGKLGYYHLGNAGKSGSTYTDSTFVIDNTRGEVCFLSGPTAAAQGDFTDSWLTLAFQLHPNDQGCVWALYDTTTGDLVSGDDPDSDTRILNLKNITASGNGVWANNIDDWPKWMTIWVNNRAAIKGQYDTTQKKYKTGLIASEDGSSSTTLRVVEGDGTTNVVTGQAITGAGAQNAAYLELDRGSDIAIGTSTTTVTENSNSAQDNTLAGELAIVSDSWSAGDKIYHNSNVDALIPDRMDCRISFCIDQIRFKHFNMLHENATVTNKSDLLSGNLRIPKTPKLSNWGYQEGTTAVDNINDAKSSQPSYLVFGFDNLTDISTAEFNGEIKRLLMCGFTNTNPSITGDIVTNADSDVSNIRAGFTTSHHLEALGRQGAADSLAGSNPDTGNGESLTFSNNGGNPNYNYKGLEVGDLDTSGVGLSVLSDGSGNDGAGNVDFFTQKGMMKFIVGHHSNARRADTGANIATSDGNAFSSGSSSLKLDSLPTDTNHLTGASGENVFQVGATIQVGDEIMLISAINSGTNTLTVTRGYGGTDAVEHANGSSVFNIAVPEKRECIFASSRILDVAPGNGKYGLIVDSPQIFNCKDDEEYIIYEYNSSHASNNSLIGSIAATFKVTERNGNEITFDKQHNINYDNKSNFLISPKRFWLIVEIFNIAGTHAFQDDTTSTVFLPEKKYDSAVLISEKGTYGATYNESLFNDGKYVNKWSLEAYKAEDNSTIIKLDDFGLGAYDKETQEGGHCGILPLTINDTSKYVYLDTNDLVKKESLKSGQTVPLCISTNEPNDNVKVNVDTEIGTNKLFMRGLYEDKLPVVSNFNVKPNEDNPFNVDFEWECSDTDLWYGFIIVDEVNVSNQYHRAVLHYPMNEEGDEGGKATAPVDQIQNMTTRVEATSTTGPFYDPYGLAGFALRFDQTGTPDIEIGSPSDSSTGDANPLGSTGFTVTDEMTINIHFKHDADADGTLAYTENLLASTERFFLEIQTDGTVKYKQYWDTNSFVELHSASKIDMDGDTPNNIMITFDANLTSGNIKLFMDGKLEDQSGEVILSDSGTSNTGWLYGANLETNNNKIHVGNEIPGTANDEFNGTIEEFVVYNKCLYPVDVKSGKFTLTKPLSEVADSSSFTPSKSYTARLFVKDYHNIRGTTSEEVACSSNISFRKAAFRFDNS